MVSNAIHATYTETYDLNTINGSLSLLAIHTPQSATLKSMFHGLYENYSKMKVLGCNFKLVCASRQELDPTLVGMSDGQIDPRDVLNPILFKACTGEGINALVDQIYNHAEADNILAASSVDHHIDSNSSALTAYYSLLSDDSWRKEHPQRGITVMGLKPFVHKVVTTQPFKWSVAPTATPNNGSNDQPRFDGKTSGAGSSFFGPGAQSGSATYSTDPINPSVFISNGLTDMPWMDTAYSKVCTYSDASGTSQGSAKAFVLQSNIPRIYMGCLILPPSVSSTMKLFFRMQIVWHIAFKDFRPATDLRPVDAPGPICDDTVGDVPQVNSLSDATNCGYFNLYHSASKLDRDVGSLDTTGVESIEVIGEKVA